MKPPSPVQWRVRAWLTAALLVWVALLPLAAPLVHANSSLPDAPAAALQWEVWQVVLLTAQAHAWYDFPVTATFTHSTGAVVQVEGFYNGLDAEGRQSWLIRFAPPLAGAWTWATHSADASLLQTGALQVAAPTAEQLAANPNLRGHLRANGHSFVYADGTPFFWLGDTVWALNSLRAGMGGGEYPNQNFTTWLADRQRRGFTVAHTQLFDLAARNEGGYPFPGNTSTPGNGAFTQLNAEHFKFLDHRLNALQAAGFVVAAAPTHLGALTLSLADAERVWRYVLARYGAYNMVWSLTREYQLKYPDAGGGGAWRLCWRYNTNAPDPECEWNQLAAAVTWYNRYQQPLSIQSAPAPAATTLWPSNWGANAEVGASSGEFQAQTWLTYNWLTAGADLTLAGQRLAADFARPPARPVIFAEGAFENAAAAGADPAEIRRQAWMAYLHGAAGYTYGASGLAEFYDPAAPEAGRPSHDGTPWATALGYPGAGYLQSVAGLLRGLTWWTLTPRQGWLMVDGAAPAGATAPALAASEQAAVLYIPRGNAGRAITLTNLPAASYHAQVYDPRFGVWASLDIAAPNHGAWTVPATAYADDADWVIVLRADPGAEEAARPAPTTTVRINFQPAGAPTPPGYLADTGRPFGDRGDGRRYGWSADNTANTRARAAALAPDARYDSFIHLQLDGAYTWEIELPNGVYTVRAVAGDAAQYNSVYQLLAEGTPLLNAAPTSTVRWIEGTALVTVADGRLTLSSGAGASANKLAFVEISATGAAPAAPTASPTEAPAVTPAPTATPSAPTVTLAALPAPGTVLVFEGEAPANTLSGTVRTVSKVRASGGRVATHLGNGPDNWLQFNAITVAETGAYTLTVHYISLQARTAFLSVNDGPATAITFPTRSSWALVGQLDLPVQLQAGANTLRFFNTEDYTPDIDRIVIAGPLAAPTPAGTLVVTRFDDTADGRCDADCSLREAVQAANANPDHTVIALAPGVYTLTRPADPLADDAGGDLDLTTPITLLGAGADVTIISALGLGERVFHVQHAAVTLSGLTVQDGAAGYSGAARNSGAAEYSGAADKTRDAGYGGGLFNEAGQVTLEGVAFINNSAAAGGGALYNTGGLTLTHSAVLSNTVTDATAAGGGLLNAAGWALIDTTTFSGNIAAGQGGAVANAAELHLAQATVAHNRAHIGGGVFNQGRLTLQGALIAGNQADQAANCDGVLHSLGFNLIQDAAGCELAERTSSDLVGVDPLLAPLADNGGPTLTQALGPASPALEAAAQCPATDQRGQARPAGAGCDIGAFERR